MKQSSLEEGVSNSDGICVSSGNALTIKDARYIVLQTYEDTAHPISPPGLLRERKAVSSMEPFNYMMMNQARNLGTHAEELIRK